MGKMLFLMSVMVLVGSSLQSIKSSSFSPGPRVLKSCARLYHPETGIQLELRSLPEKIPVGAGGSGGLSSFRVMEGCVLTLWGGAHSRSFPSGAYPNITVGGSSAFHCSCENRKCSRLSETRYQKFIRQHVDPSRKQGNDRYCDYEMRKRCMTKPKYKQINTFIHDKAKKIKAVCNEKADQEGIRTSSTNFKITICELNAKHRKYRAHNANRHIKMNCDDRNLPVHFVHQVSYH